MLPKSESTAVVEKLVSGGDGLVRVDGEVVFLPGVLEGEEVRFQLVKKGKGFSQGRTLEILKPSIHRVQPECALYGRCGGCDFMHLDYPAQLRAKRTMVQESFLRLAKLRIELPEMISGPEWGYRSRLQIHVDLVGRLGFMARSSEKVVEVPNCPVAHPSFASFFEEKPALKPGRYALFASGKDWYLEGRDRFATVELLGKRMVLSLDGFFQSNLALLPELLRYVQASFPEGRTTDTLLDLYCGSGLFGAFLADRFEKVIAVEENASALALAKTNIPGPTHEFIAKSLEDWVAQRKRQNRVQDWEAAVVDPPRNGLSAGVRDFLVKNPPRRLVYVSCNPDTLARDTASLLNGGFVLEELQLFDFYPQTSHVEAVGRFRHEH